MATLESDANEMELGVALGNSSSIEFFLEYSSAELKHFLLHMGESVSGCRAELAERCLFAQQRKKKSGPSEPKKFKIERGEEKGEYASLLEEIGLVDPDVEDEWTEDISGLPSIDVGKIFHYVLTKEAFETYYLSDFKSSKAYQFLEAVCVRSIQVHTAADNRYVFVKGTIAPLHKTGKCFDAIKTPNIVKILTTCDNDILVSCCTCTSNLYQCCNHVIAVLLRMERLSREMEGGDSDVQTEDPSPSLEKGSSKPVKISDVFKKKDPFAQTLMGKIHKPAAEEKRRFMEKICQTLPNSLFAQMFKGSVGVTQAADRPFTETITVTTEAQQLAGLASKTTVASQKTSVQTIPVTLTSRSSQVLPTSTKLTHNNTS